MLTFKSFIINDVDLCQRMLTSVLTFKLLVINVVDLVDLYMSIYKFRSPNSSSRHEPALIVILTSGF